MAAFDPQTDIRNRPETVPVPEGIARKTVDDDVSDNPYRRPLFHVPPRIAALAGIGSFVYLFVMVVCGSLVPLPGDVFPEILFGVLLLAGALLGLGTMHLSRLSIVRSGAHASRLENLFGVVGLLGGLFGLLMNGGALLVWGVGPFVWDGFGPGK